MSMVIKRWFDAHAKARQWAWFLLLWCGGLGCAMALSYPIKWLIRMMG